MKKEKKLRTVEVKYVKNPTEVPNEVIDKLAEQLLPEMKKMAHEKEKEEK
ncbi:MAG: hypothetical protein R3Y63_10265 [Eubacteriales bacterium]